MIFRYTTNTPEEIMEMLMKNWERVYNGNRAPWGLYAHSGWFDRGDWHYQGYKKFIEYISSLDDVWIVPIREGIEYVKAPMSHEDLLAAGKNSVFGCQKNPLIRLRRLWQLKTGATSISEAGDMSG